MQEILISPELRAFKLAVALGTLDIGDKALFNMSSRLIEFAERLTILSGLVGRGSRDHRALAAIETVAMALTRQPVLNLLAELQGREFADFFPLLYRDDSPLKLSSFVRLNEYMNDRIPLGEGTYDICRKNRLARISKALLNHLDITRLTDSNIRDLELHRQPGPAHLCWLLAFHFIYEETNAFSHVFEPRPDLTAYSPESEEKISELFAQHGLDLGKLRLGLQDPEMRRAIQGEVRRVLMLV